MVAKGGFTPEEFSTWDDVANGTEVLYRSILKLDKQMSAR